MVAPKPRRAKIAASKTSAKEIDRMRRGGPSVTLPGTGKVNLPGRAGLLWYAGIAAMAATELIEWPVALLVAGTHFIENHSHSRDVQELADGIGSGA